MVSLRGIATYKNPTQRTRFEEFAECGGHWVFIDTKYEGDRAHCGCGWSSTPYWDGADLAWSKWYEHVRESAARMQTLETL